MRTTVDLPDTLFRRIKAASAMRGMTLKAFIQAALLRELGRQAPTGPSRRVQLPLVPSSSPGSLELSNDRVAELLEEDEGNVSS